MLTNPMLTHLQKIQIFKSEILSRNESYADTMKDEIYFFFFENEYSFDFLNELNSEEAIKNKVAVLIHQMIMHEDENELRDIIQCAL
jgi:hypothetical protein